MEYIATVEITLRSSFHVLRYVKITDAWTSDVSGLWQMLLDLCTGHKDHTAVLKQVKQSRYRLRCGLGLATESCVRWRPGFPRRRGGFVGGMESPSPL